MQYWGVDREYYRETRHLWLEDFGKVLDKVRAGELRPVIAGCYRLGQAVETNEELVSGANVKGKMIFVVDEALDGRAHESVTHCYVRIPVTVAK